MPDRSAPNAAAAAPGSAHLPLSAPAAAAPVFPHRVAREFRAALGFVFGLVSGFTAFAHQDDWLVVPFALLGIVLLAGAALALRERTRIGSRALRWGRRLLTGVAAIVLLLFVVTPIAGAVWLTQAPRERVDPEALPLPHEDVALHTSDGLRLAAWYVPSRNGAAVVVVHGGGGTREGSVRHTLMLARHGYGVLLYDARGNGESEGRHDAMGWTWEPDVEAAATWLSHRRDVDPQRIAALGISTGAEAVLQAAAHDPRIAAVVSDGAIARNLAETRQLEGAAEAQAVPYYGLMFATLRLVTGHSQPPPLQRLIPAIAPRPVLLIASGEGTERTMNRAYHRAAPASQLWELPAVEHTHGLRDESARYERRVTTFLDRTLAHS
jgi:dienelactone hydrolase